MKKIVIILSVIIVITALAAAVVSFLSRQPVSREFKPPSGKYSIIANRLEEGGEEIVLVSSRTGEKKILVKGCNSMDLYWSPDKKHFLLSIRTGSNCSLMAVFRSGTDQPQLIDCIYQLDDQGIVEPMFLLFAYKPKGNNLFDQALKGFPKDIGYRHVYCSFVKWLDNKQAVLNVTMYDPADKYYQAKDKKVLAGIDRDYIYQIK